MWQAEVRSQSLFLSLLFRSADSRSAYLYRQQQEGHSARKWVLLKIHTTPSILCRPSDKAQVYYAPKSVALSPKLKTFDKKLKLVKIFREVFIEKHWLKTPGDHRLRAGVWLWRPLKVSFFIIFDHYVHNRPQSPFVFTFFVYKWCPSAKINSVYLVLHVIVEWDNKHVTPVLSAAHL